MSRRLERKRSPSREAGSGDSGSDDDDSRSYTDSSGGEGSYTDDSHDEADGWVGAAAGGRAESAPRQVHNGAPSVSEARPPATATAAAVVEAAAEEEEAAAPLPGMELLIAIDTQQLAAELLSMGAY